MPVPVRVCTAGEFEALLANVIAAVATPLALGVKVTIKGMLWPAAIVCGSVMPESANSLLLLLPEETVTEAPVAVNEPPRAELVPTMTLPKSSVDGDTESSPAAVPVPDRGTLSGEFEASETIERVPLVAPEAAGVNVAVKLRLWPGNSVVGRVNPVIEKAAPVRLACVMVTEEPPVLLKVSTRLALLPT